MTKQQLSDLKLWKEDQDQELPVSLENVFIDECEKYIVENQGILNLHPIFQILGEIIYTSDETITGMVLENLRTLSILTLLSRTPEGEAVMLFLDVETKIAKEYWIQGEINGVIQECFEYFTLDHLLYREFTEALRVGKTFDEALKIINKAYLVNIG